jgi:hypothetical protein
MMALEVTGTLADASTFPTVSRQTLARWLCADNPIFVEELRDLAQKTGSDEALNFLNGVVRKQKRHRAIKALIDSMPVLAGMMPAVSRLRRRLRAAA